MGSRKIEINTRVDEYLGILRPHKEKTKPSLCGHSPSASQRCHISLPNRSKSPCQSEALFEEGKKKQFAMSQTLH
jgi:hypothetical protein